MCVQMNYLCVYTIKYNKYMYYRVATPRNVDIHKRMIWYEYTHTSRSRSSVGLGTW